MTELFKIAVGHYEDGEVTDFIPYQPLTPGLQYTSRTPTANGVVAQGPFIRFVFGVLNEVEFRAMLGQAGVLTSRRCPVTLYAQDENYNWLYLYGFAIKPANEGRRGFHLNNVPLLITGIFGLPEVEDFA